MKVLLTGNTGYLTNAWIDSAFEGARVLIAGESHVKNTSKVTTIKGHRATYKKLFEAYDIDLVVLFSERLTFQSKRHGDLERLETLLGLCRQNRAVKLLYLDGPEPANEHGRGVLHQAAEQLCLQAGREDVIAQVLRIPYLYSGDCDRDYFYRMFASLDRSGEFDFGEEPAQRANFMAMDDLAELIRRMVEEWPMAAPSYVAPDGFGLQFADIERKLREINSSWRFEYAKNQPVSAYDEDDLVLRRMYGWFPKISILHDLEEMARRYQAVKPGSRSLYQWFTAWRDKHKRLLLFLELIVACLLTVLCGHLSDWQVQFGLIDFRLLLVVLIATMHGLGMGILAATAASVMLVIAYLQRGTNWMTLFYEPTNWIPFIAYYAVGSVCGYLRLIAADKLRFAQEENESLREKLIFAQSMYNDVLSDKREYKKQIVGSKDSFGKIFDITQQLRLVHETEVFIKAIEILESIMENKTIALYSVSRNQQYARLIASSKETDAIFKVSVNLSEYEEAMTVVNKGEVFSNNAMLEGYPMYMAGIRRDDQLRMVAVIKEAEYSQMTLYYINLFKILCGLISASLTRALEHQELRRKERCVEDTGILTAEYFKKRLDLEREMNEKKIARHILLRLDAEGRTVQEIDHLLSTRIRENDVIGFGEDGAVYVILTQATHQTLPVVLKRLETTGLHCSVVTAEETQD